MASERRLERETGIEPATNSLEGCDSTTELLPPSCSRAFSGSHYGGASPPQSPFGETLSLRCLPGRRSRPRCGPPSRSALRRVWLACQPKLVISQRAEVGGEGRIRTSEAARATDLQSAAFDRSATSPVIRPRDASHAPSSRDTDTSDVPRDDSRVLVCAWKAAVLGVYPESPAVRSGWSWRRDLNPRPADYKSAALPD